MLNNLAQSNEKNRQTIMQLMVPIEEFSKEKQPAVKAMIEYFYKCEDKARRVTSAFFILIFKFLLNKHYLILSE